MSYPDPAYKTLPGGGLMKKIAAGAPVEYDTLKELANGKQDKNKAYAPLEFSGLGKKTLEKNIVNVSGTNKNVLTQAMINDTNTIYVIQYDYDLNGQSITVPSGCVLQFEGGSLSNGTLVGSDTKIEAKQQCVFNNIAFSGAFICAEIYPEWFVASSDADMIQKAINAASVINGTICLTAKEYLIDTTITINGYVRIDGSKGASLKSTSGIPIFEGSLTGSILNAIKFYGNGRVGNSIGIKMTGGYQVSITNCNFYSLDIGIRLAGVIVTIDKCYFTENNYGIATYKKNNISTCVSILNSNFVDNRQYGFTDNLYPDEKTTEAPTLNVGCVAKLVFKNTVFELNACAIAVRRSRGKVIDTCWFERNTNASPIVKVDTYISHVYYSSDPGLTNYELNPNEHGYNYGSINMLDNDGIRSKFFRFAYFGDNYNAIDNGTMYLQEGRFGVSNNVRHILARSINDERSLALNTVETISKNYFPTVTAYAYINEDGSINRSSQLIDSSSYSTENNVYIIKLKGVIRDCNVLVTPYSYNSYPIAYVSLRNTTNYSGGKTNGTCNQIYVKIFNQGSDIPVKLPFHISILYSRTS